VKGASKLVVIYKFYMHEWFVAKFDQTEQWLNLCLISCALSVVGSLKGWVILLHWDET
jgi:hypothetical protein